MTGDLQDINATRVRARRALLQGKGRVSVATYPERRARIHRYDWMPARESLLRTEQYKGHL